MFKSIKLYFEKRRERKLRQWCLANAGNPVEADIWLRYLSGANVSKEYTALLKSGAKDRIFHFIEVRPQAEFTFGKPECWNPLKKDPSHQ